MLEQLEHMDMPVLGGRKRRSSKLRRKNSKRRKTYKKKRRTGKRSRKH